MYSHKITKHKFLIVEFQEMMRLAIILNFVTAS